METKIGLRYIHVGSKEKSVMQQEFYTVEAQTFAQGQYMGRDFAVVLAISDDAAMRLYENSQRWIGLRVETMTARRATEAEITLHSRMESLKETVNMIRDETGW